MNYLKTLALLLVISAPNLTLAANPIIDGATLPLGVSLGDTRDFIDSTILSTREFGIPAKQCGDRTLSLCTFSFRENGVFVGSVVVRYPGSTGSGSDEAGEFTWYFDDWQTNEGRTLSDLGADNVEELFLESYPGADVFQGGNNLTITTSGLYTFYRFFDRDRRQFFFWGRIR